MIDLGSELSKAKPKAGKVKFIAVDGHGGSGKSTLANLLAKRLEAEIIHTDDFSGWDNPINWYPDLIEQVLEPISKGAKSLSYQPVSWWEDHHPEPIVDQLVTPIMILEGITASRKEFSRYVSFRIFVDTPIDICLERGIERDVSAERSKGEVIELWKGLFAEEDEYFERDRPKENADAVLDGTKPFEEQILV